LKYLQYGADENEITSQNLHLISKDYSVGIISAVMESAASECHNSIPELMLYWSKPEQAPHSCGG